MNSPRHTLIALLLCGLLLLVINAPARAGSATWNLDPATSRWNLAANWTPATVPDGPADTATFDVSNQPSVTLFAGQNLNVFQVADVVFNPGASAFTITCLPFAHLAFYGTGIINNSGITQNFVTQVVESQLGIGVVEFYNEASAGSSTTFVNSSARTGSTIGGTTTFRDQSTAGSATFINQGGSASASWGGDIDFYDSSSAGHGTFTNMGPTVPGARGGQIMFHDSSNADHGSFINEGGASIYFFANSSAGRAIFTNNGGTVGLVQGSIHMSDSASCGTATFVNNGGTVAGAMGAVLSMFANAGGATLIANGGIGGGEGARVRLGGQSKGGKAHLKVFGNGSLDISGHERLGVIIGSLEGDGNVFLGAETLGVGSNDLNTRFSGVIADGGEFGGTGGGLVKVGIGSLKLDGTNTYTGGTAVTEGALGVNNTIGSGTGSGDVQVDAGTLRGNGIIAGVVTIGTGSGSGAFLAPGEGMSKPATLTIQDALTSKADATYTYKLNTKKAKADQVVANGVTIDSGAQFSFNAVANETLTVGTAFTAISNTSSNPIGGTFANLPDGSTVTVGGNNFQVSYAGGDGNDLTLTVIP